MKASATCGQWIHDGLRQTLVWLLIGVALVAPRHGLAAGERLTREQVQLALWHDGSRHELKDVGVVMRLVQAEHKGLIVNVRPMPTMGAFSQLHEWAEASDKTGLPDLVIVPDVWLSTFAYALQPLEGLLPERAIEPYPESVREQLHHAGHLYGVPWAARARALFYRPSILDAAGMLPPRTWDELLICARRCSDPPQVYGFGLPAAGDGAPKLLLQVLWSQGGEIPPVDDPSRLDVNKLHKALEVFRELHEASQPEALTWDQPSLEDFFASGRLAMLIADNTFERYLGVQAPELDYATAALPEAAASGALVSVNLVCLLKSSRHKEAAAKALSSLTGLKISRERLKLGGVPLHRDLVPEIELSEKYAAYVQQLEHTRCLPVERWKTACSIFAEGLFHLLTGRASIEKTCHMIRNGFTEREDIARRPEARFFGHLRASEQ